MPIEEDELPLPKGFSLLPGTWVRWKSGTKSTESVDRIGKVLDLNRDYFNPNRIMLSVAMFDGQGTPLRRTERDGSDQELVEQGSPEDLWESVQPPDFTAPQNSMSDPTVAA